MSWQPINFQSIITLNRPFVDQLDKYLEEKEAYLAVSLAKVFNAYYREEPALEEKQISKLSESIEEISRKIRQDTADHADSDQLKDWNEVAKECNSLFWEHVEALSSCSQELYYRISQIGLENWHEEYMNLVKQVTDSIIHRVEDTEWAVKRIEEKLWEYRALTEKENGFIAKLKRKFSNILDKNLISRLQQCQNFLKTQYANYHLKYSQFRQIDSKADSIVQKVRYYALFQVLERGQQEKYLSIYHLLKLWELNSKSKSLEEKDFVRAIYSVSSTDKTIQLFRDYYKLLKNGLFEKSKAIKVTPEELFFDSSVRGLIYSTLLSYQAETHTLAATVGTYREFILRTDPNPYVRSRWGFSQSIVGPEPESSKQLHNLEYDLEALSKLYDSLCQSFQRGPVSPDQTRVLGVDDKEIQNALHEMGQPLASHNLLKTRITHIVNKLNDMNELGSYGMQISDYIRIVLSKILRLDWKYNTFNEINEFKSVYEIHKGIFGKIKDRGHLSRLDKFRALIADIKDKVSHFNKANGKASLENLEHDIEADIHDIKIYLQDFLAYLQRVWNDKNIQPNQLKEIVVNGSEELLEYRYLFGKFFWFLSKFKKDGLQLRNQFLFVDQYFETIDQKIQELKAQSSLKL